MEWFEKFFSWTIMIGFAALGVACGLVVIRVAVGVTGVLLGSTLGTFIVAWVLWRCWKSYEKKNSEKTE